MAKKKRRRGAQSQRQTDLPGSAGQTGHPGPDEAAKAERRAQQKREWAEQKRKDERDQHSNAPFIWGGGIAAVVAVLVVGGFFIFSGGGDDSSDEPTATPRPDSRIAGLPIDETITVNMNDNGQNVNPRFEPNNIQGEAGQVIEIITPNIGSVAHNLRFAGVNGEYEAGAPSSDDWLTTPESIDAGEEGRVVVKFDEPGAYPFKCDFHPTQTGTLVIS